MVPRAEQASGFALIIDRRLSDFATVRLTFQKVVTLFPARIREVYLLHGPRGLAKDMITSQLVEEFLLDFDIFNVSEPGDLVHYVETKYIPADLGGHLISDVEGWLVLQEHVETFSFSARRIARRLAQFVGILNQVSKFWSMIHHIFTNFCKILPTFSLELKKCYIFCKNIQTPYPTFFFNFPRQSPFCAE